MNDDWIDVDTLPLVADESWLYQQRGNGTATTATDDPPVTIVPHTAFTATTEATAEALLGTPDETLLPADGMLLMYGDGGAGKTTLTLDAACHLATGTGWLNIQVDRPSRITLIENEGPRGKFRQTLATKTSHHPGIPDTSLHVLEDPWSRFTLREPTHRQALAHHIDSCDIDIVIMGPLAALGMVGGGTPDEITAFEHLIRDTRTLTSRPVALWIVHHENKAGDVSGAWERVPDTLAHVIALGNGRTKLVWRKARWSSAHHGTSVDLTWEEGRTFTVVEDKVRDLYTEMTDAFTADDEWRTVKEAAQLIHVSEGDAKKVLAELTRQGVLRYERGPAGRHGSANCWRLNPATLEAREN